VKYFHRLVEVDPSQDAPNWRLGIAYYFNEQYAESAAQFAQYHDYDGRDRENGVWKFLGDARAGGLEKARAEMLPYKEFDREPFPALYDVYAGKLSQEDFNTRLQQRGLTEDPRVMFFAHYYMGLYEEMLDHHEAALARLDQAIALFTPEEAGASGPGYMYHVARTHREWLTTHRGTAKPSE
jgi:lipoprotein NlpI